MNVEGLIRVLEKLVEEGKGKYSVFDEGYMNEVVEEENVTVDDNKKRVYI